MYIQVDKPEKSNSQLTTNKIGQKAGIGKCAFQLVDKRSETAIQRTLQGIANNKPPTNQLRTVPNQPDYPPQEKQSVHLKSVVDNYSPPQHQAIQKKKYDASLPDDLKSGTYYHSDSHLLEQHQQVGVDEHDISYSELGIRKTGNKWTGGTVLQQQPVLQLGRSFSGGNPKGRGGKGKKYQPIKHQQKKDIDKGTLTSNWRKSIAKKKQSHHVAGHIPQPQRPQPQEEQQPNFMNHNPQGRPRQAPAEQPPHVVINIPQDARQQTQEEQPPYVLIDMPQERGVRKRIRDKAFSGRTFGDSSNIIGGAGSLTEDTTAATLTIIGGAGVLASGLKLFYSSLSMNVKTNEDRREQLYTGLMGLANMTSGVSAIESAINALHDKKHAATVIGNVSVGAMAVTELTNIISQSDIIMSNFQQGKSISHYIGPIAALLESLIKCIGCMISLLASMEIGMTVMVIGAAIGVLHGIIKLIIMCQQSRYRDNALEEPDIENQV